MLPATPPAVVMFEKVPPTEDPTSILAPGSSWSAFEVDIGPYRPSVALELAICVVLPRFAAEMT